MRIGLMRHYKVSINNNKIWMDSVDFSNWVKQYDQSNIYINSSFDTKFSWDVCYSSDMIRAIKTAEAIYKGRIIKTKQLREIEINPLFDSRMRFHLNVWLILGRFGWLLNHPSQENKNSTLLRARAFLDDVEENNQEHHNVLIVSHGAFMTVLKQELNRRGYRGDKFAKPQNGRIYTYTRNLCE